MKRKRNMVWLLSVAALSVLLVVSSCTTTSQAGPPDEVDDGGGDYIPHTFYLPDENGSWELPGLFTGQLPTGTGQITLEGIGTFSFESEDVERMRPEIFAEGHFSIFDALLQLDKQGDITVDYYFDETMDTHVINTINGKSDWWYFVYYSGGWFEDNVFRMDMYPYKNDTYIEFYQTTISLKIEQAYRGFKQEVARLAENNGEVILPKVVVGHKTFKDVRVTPHNVRTDVLQPGVITAFDILLSLAEQGEISRMKVTWYESIRAADPIDDYFTELIDMGDGFSDDEAVGRCGWVYETGPENLPGFLGSHIHIPSDVRVIVSPDYALWFWICI